MSQVRMDAIVLRTADPTSLSGFYQRSLDLPEPQWQDTDHMGMRAGNLYLGFDLAKPGSEGGRGATTVWFKVQNTRETHDRMVELGALSTMAPDSTCSPGETLATLTDPEGNAIGLISPSGQ